MKKGVGSFSQSYESEDPDPHQNVTDPEHWSPCNSIAMRDYSEWGGEANDERAGDWSAKPLH
jgi:hypothetical protein